MKHVKDMKTSFQKADNLRSMALNVPFSVVGRWSLVSIDTDENNLPGHRVDFDFREGPEGLHGVVLNRFAGAEIPLQTLTFDGETLRLQMSPPPKQQMDPLPFLVMTRVGDRFEGRWDMKAAQHLHLKLLRTGAARQSLS